jgi:hypothetical protein
VRKSKIRPQLWRTRGNGRDATLPLFFFFLSPVGAIERRFNRPYGAQRKKGSLIWGGGSLRFHGLAPRGYITIAPCGACCRHSPSLPRVRSLPFTLG